MAMINSKSGEVTVRSLIQYIQDLASYANLYEYNETQEAGHWAITLFHEHEKKWSVFLANYFAEAFKATGTEPVIEMSERAITIKI